jgi:hypothetical protein
MVFSNFSKNKLHVARAIFVVFDGNFPFDAEKRAITQAFYLISNNIEVDATLFHQGSNKMGNCSCNQASNR